MKEETVTKMELTYQGKPIVTLTAKDGISRDEALKGILDGLFTACAMKEEKDDL